MEGVAQQGTGLGSTLSSQCHAQFPGCRSFPAALGERSIAEAVLAEGYLYLAWSPAKTAVRGPDLGCRG